MPRIPGSFSLVKRLPRRSPSKKISANDVNIAVPKIEKFAKT
jgi:hypothetical protein